MSSKFTFKDNSDKVMAELKKELIARVTQACMVVESQAKSIAPVGGGTGQLRDSITHNVEEKDGEIIGQVGSSLMYAPYVEFGSGEFAENGQGRKGYWVYVKGSEGGIRSNGGKSYTFEEAKRVVAILREKGLDAHMTKGMKPRPFLRRAFRANSAKIKAILGDKIEKLSD